MMSGIDLEEQNVEIYLDKIIDNTLKEFGEDIEELEGLFSGALLMKLMHSQHC